MRTATVFPLLAAVALALAACGDPVLEPGAAGARAPTGPSAPDPLVTTGADEFAFEFTPGGNTLHQIFVIDQQTQQAVQLTRVTISFQFQDGTGGHSHADPPAPRDAVFADPATIITDAQGIATFRIRSKRLDRRSQSGLAGVYRMSIACPDLEAIGRSCLQPDPDLVAVRLTGLMPLPGIPLDSANAPIVPSEGPILLTGATDDHPRNHFGTALTVRAVQSVAEKFFAITDVGVRVNDMSLEWGGLFDCDSQEGGCGKGTRDWMSPHETHLIGTQVDFDIRFLCDDVCSITGDITTAPEWLLLIQMIESCGGTIYQKEWRSHFHATFGGALAASCASDQGFFFFRGVNR